MVKEAWDDANKLLFKKRFGKEVYLDTVGDPQIFRLVTGTLGQNPDPDALYKHPDLNKQGTTIKCLCNMVLPIVVGRQRVILLDEPELGLDLASVTSFADWLIQEVPK